MLDHLSDGRLEFGVGRGGVLEAYFWNSDYDVEGNYARFREVLEIVKAGLANEELTHKGRFYAFDALPMRLRPVQQPYPPMWYMRNVETAAIDGMNAIIVGNLDSFEANVQRYRELWTEHHGPEGRTLQGTPPKIGLVNHIVLAESDEEAVAIAGPAWKEYVHNLETPRRVEAERRGLKELFQISTKRPAGLPDREADPARYRVAERSEEERRRRMPPGNIGGDGSGAGFSVIAGRPDSVRAYMDEYLATGANYFVCSFQWGNLTHEHALRSIDLFVKEIMPRYA